MILELREKTYSDYKVYSVTRIKGKYGFRVKLIFDENDTITHQISGFKTIKEAEEKRNITISELENHTYIVYPKIKVELFFKHWLNEVMVLKYNSYNSYKNVIDNYIIKEYGNMYMSTLNQSHIQKFYNKVAKQSESIVKLAKTIFNTSMKYAKSVNIISVNIANGVNLPKSVKSKEYRTLKIDKSKVYTMEQMRTLVYGSKDSPIHLEILFALLMGFRISEINGLKYTDIDFVNGKLYFETQLGTEYEVDKETLKVKTKTKQDIKPKTTSSKRWQDIPDLLFEAILEQRKKYEKNRKRRINDKTNPFRDDEYIVCSTYGKPRSRGYHDSHYKELIKKLGLPYIKFHDLRHSYATLLLMANFNPKAISVLLGHSKEIVTVDNYCDKTQIVYDCLDLIEPYIENVIPTGNEYGTVYDCTIYDFKIDDYINEIIDV